MSVHVHNSDLVQMKVLPCRSEFHGEPRSKGRGPRLSARVLTSLQFQLYRLGSDRRWLCLSKRSHALRMRKFDSPTTTLRGILQPIVQDRLLETDSNSSRKSLSSPQLWSPGVLEWGSNSAPELVDATMASARRCRASGSPQHRTYRAFGADSHLDYDR